MDRNRNKNNDGVDLFAAFTDLMVILICKLMDGIVWIINWLLKRYVFGDGKSPIKKVESRHLTGKGRTSRPESIGYSLTRKKDFPADELARGTHTLICGASGFGKSVLMETLMDADMAKGKPVIFIDPKGDARSMRRFIQLCHQHGRKYAVFSEHFRGEGKLHLNPVEEGTPTQIADRIHRSFNWSEEHYETLCYQALKKACSLLAEKDHVITYKNLMQKLLDLSNPGSKEKMFDRKNIGGIIARLDNIVDSDFGPMLGSDGFSMKYLWNANGCVYIGLPVLGYPQIARALGKTLLGDLAYAAYDAYKFDNPEKLPAGIYIDELSAVITHEFIELLNKCRGVGMELTFAFQSPADLDEVSPNLCLQIMENAANWFVLKQRMKAGAMIFSESIGTIPGKKETVRIEDGEQMAMGSRREVHELIAHSDIIKNLGRGQALLLQHAPTRVDLINVKYIDIGRQE